MHAKPDLRVVFNIKINRSGSVIIAVILPELSLDGCAVDHALECVELMLALERFAGDSTPGRNRTRRNEHLVFSLVSHQPCRCHHVLLTPSKVSAESSAVMSALANCDETANRRCGRPT